uniref:Uncharacterized protein n=1 Tax=Anguilla anguilla TaxID=7936 RepID=A0A0E9PZN9_ANGAN
MAMYSKWLARARRNKIWPARSSAPRFHSHMSVTTNACTMRHRAIAPGDNRAFMAHERQKTTDPGYFQTSQIPAL